MTEQPRFAISAFKQLVVVLTLVLYELALNEFMSKETHVERSMNMYEYVGGGVGQGKQDWMKQWGLKRFKKK